MVALAVVGAVVITTALIAFTIGFYGTVFFSYAMSGLFGKEDVIILIIGTLILGLSWTLWWLHIASNITIGFG